LRSRSAASAIAPNVAIPVSGMKELKNTDMVPGI